MAAPTIATATPMLTTAIAAISAGERFLDFDDDGGCGCGAGTHWACKGGPQRALLPEIYATSKPMMVTIKKLRFLRICSLNF